MTRMFDSPIGNFQWEKSYSNNMLRDYHPTKIDDMTLINAAIRPSGASFRDRLLAGEVNKNPSPIIDELLKDNKGYLVYQEDTIKFLMQICNLSGSEADNIRRAIARKKKEILNEAMPSILEGYCSKSKQPKEIAEREAMTFIKILEDSASYQFGLTLAQVKLCEPIHIGCVSNN